MSTFLLELRSEEIPARMQKGARAELEKLFRREMDGAGVTFGELTVWSTPRRLALIARDLPEQTEAVSEEAKGPPEGAPDQAIDGFCRKNGLSRDQLELRDVKGRNTYFAVIDTPGRAVKDVLAEAIPAIIRDFSWPKSQRWGAASISTESLRWVRPLSGIVALLGHEVVECEVHGAASSNVTKGHRFHSAGEITIGGAQDYAAKLRDAHVIVDHSEREAIIREGAAKAASDAGLDLVEDEGLVVENAGLTEWPVPLLGRFEDDFLEVPPETIQLTARVNQKYFVCEKDDKLANAFICTANIDADDPAVVVEGNRKVLAARLSDAKFFWDVDRKKTLAQHAEGLERITFHEKLGTVADKVERVAKLARWLVEEGIVKLSPVRPEPVEGLLSSSEKKGRASTSSAQTVEELANQAELAARLCKADLVTEMVGEFPELQGLMGGYYARAEGLDDAVADAIRDHYKPVGQGDDVPTAPVTVAVSLADKLDTIFGFFLIDELPTGSKDPFALRRATLGAIRTFTTSGARGNLLSILEHWLEFYAQIGMTWLIDRESIREEQSRRGEVPDYGLWFRAFGYLMREIEDKEQMESRFRFESVVAGKINPKLSLSFVADILGHDKPEPETWYEGTAVLHEWTKPIGIFEDEVLDFFADRLKVQQREAGVRHDLIDAVFALGGEDDLVRLLARVHALQSFMDTDNGANLLAGYKRAANILKKEGHLSSVRLERSRETGGEGVSTTLDVNGIIELSYTPEKAEKALIDALAAARPQAAAAIKAEDFATAMTALASLRAPIDAFFEEVTVNDDNQDKREARLGLLLGFRNLVHQVADFSKIEG